MPEKAALSFALELTPNLSGNDISAAGDYSGPSEDIGYFVSPHAFFFASDAPSLWR